MVTRANRVRHERAKDADAKKVVFRSAGGALFGKNPVIKDKTDADHVIAVMLGNSRA